MSIVAKVRTRLQTVLITDRLPISLAVIGVIASSGALFSALSSLSELEDRSQATVVSIQSQVEVAQLRNDLDRLRIRLEAIQGLAASGASVSDEAARVQQLDTRLSIIEKGLVETPERALAVPMLRRDLAGLERASGAQIQALRDDVGRLYTLMVWLIGIIVTVSLGLVSLIFAASKAKRTDATQPTV